MTSSELTLAEWWRALTEDEIGMAIPKAGEYGTIDLIHVGRELASMAGFDDIPEALAIEYGVYFYMRGKMARMSASLRRGRSCSSDTVLDLGIYVKIIQRARACGDWPGQL